MLLKYNNYVTDKCFNRSLKKEKPVCTTIHLFLKSISQTVAI